MAGEITAIINIFVETEWMEKVTEAVASLPETVDVYEVTGEFDLVAVARASDIMEFRRFIKDKVMKIKGIKSTVTSIILYTHKKDGKLVSE
ncbi:MAG: Lrp/AsnC ligand binding domain-containing protein [Candidatus Bathyarchaeia archaeon]|nr:Lrp/AsnC ligand binding domain-containing protein [Candidatus Bathyarchaeota archaeon]